MCFWMRSRGTNVGTPFSYAVPGRDNELIVYNYKDFHLYIGGNSRLVQGKINTKNFLSFAIVVICFYFSGSRTQ